MNFGELIEDVAVRSKTSMGSAKANVETVIGAIRDALLRGEEVRIAGLGTLFVASRAAMRGRNLRTGKPLEIPAQRGLKFRPTAAFKAGLNPPAPASAEKRKRA